MKWIGLTGGIASGKSTTATILRRRGLAVVDADELARAAVQIGSAGFDDVVRAFGPEIVARSGELDRTKLGAMVFADALKLARLEDIIHPRVRELAAKRKAELMAEGRAFGFYDVPLLFEKNMRPTFDSVVAVICGPELQVSRAVARGLNEAEAKKRIAAQLPIAQKIQLADDVIVNDGTPAELEAEVDRYLAKIGAFHQAKE